MRLGKSQALAIYLGPPKAVRARFPYAPYQHYWGTARPSEHPDVWAPTDLGRIVLSRGIRLSGRMVDTEGRPIEGQNIWAFPVTGRDQHTTTTETDGTFSLGPLRPANYLIYGDGQEPVRRCRTRYRAVAPADPCRAPGAGLSAGRRARSRRSSSASCRLSASNSASSIPQGRPARGSAAEVWGIVPNDEGQAGAWGAHSTLGRRAGLGDQQPRTARHSGPHRLEHLRSASCRRPHAFLAPRDCSKRVSQPPLATTLSATRPRLQPNGPLRFWGGGQLGVLDEDRQITVVAYRSPTVIVTVKTEEGRVPDDLEVGANFTSNGGSYGDSFARQPDGRYRGRGLMPDHEYEIRAWSRKPEYVQKGLPRLNLPEGGSAHLTIVLRKRPAPAAVGGPAPSFSIRALEGRALSLDAMRGKTVLLHFWSPVLELRDASSLKAVHEQFAHDKRFAMIGLCLSNESEAAGQSIRSMGLNWPHALLRDRDLDPIAVAYGPECLCKAFLIGPDGRLIARDLEGPALETAVAGALAGK